ncbi:hypothetical protein ABIE09_002513 [Lysobacter enzymogenes]|uniref:hypothetical protein n=1 Tax=Lysobacter enzymogenes TaxID=69 RepID=UPI00339A1808
MILLLLLLLLPPSANAQAKSKWIPAFAGMTGDEASEAISRARVVALRPSPPLPA